MSWQQQEAEMCLGCMQILAPKLIATYDGLQVERATQTLLILTDRNERVSYACNRPVCCEKCERRQTGKLKFNSKQPFLTFEHRLDEVRKAVHDGKRLGIETCSGCLKMCMVQLAEIYEEYMKHLDKQSKEHAKRTE